MAALRSLRHFPFYAVTSLAFLAGFAFLQLGNPAAFVLGFDTQPAQQEETDSQPRTLQQAIKAGMQSENGIDERVYLQEYSIQSPEDARAVCDALRKLPLPQGSGTVRLWFPILALGDLMMRVDQQDSAVVEVLRKEGTPELIRLFDDIVKEAGKFSGGHDEFRILEVLALYQTREGTETIVAAARRPMAPRETDAWRRVFSQFDERHPLSKFLFRTLSDPPPPDAIGVALLDCANGLVARNQFSMHPFDTEVGWQYLQSFYRETEQKYYKDAYIATSALQFVRNPQRDRILDCAMKYPDKKVQVRAAFLAVQHGRPDGLEFLVNACRNPLSSKTAQKSLTELHREELIPAEVHEPDFVALAEFADWADAFQVAGSMVMDEVELIDTRELTWPPRGKPERFWLIKYRIRDADGLRGVGVDYGLMSDSPAEIRDPFAHNHAPEDVYAVQCCYEMMDANLIDVYQGNVNADQGAVLLSQWTGGRLEFPTMTFFAQLSPVLDPSSRMVAVASAMHRGERGWAVIDGPKSAWYPRNEFSSKELDKFSSEEEFELSVLLVHIGRQLLAINDQPDRKKYVANPYPEAVTSKQFADAYERLMAEIPQATPRRQKTLVCTGELLVDNLDQYVEALVDTSGRPKTDVYIDVYERMLSLVPQSHESIRNDACSCVGILGLQRFDSYISALLERGREDEVPRLIDTLSGYWNDSVTGHRMLGDAAFRANWPDIAERHLLKCRELPDPDSDCKEMSLLAEIWHRKGKDKEARRLLVDCMRSLVSEIDKPSTWNRSAYSERFRHHRTTYLLLFPENEKELADLGIPAEIH